MIRRSMSNRAERQSAFTLVELMVVLGVIAIVAALVVPAVGPMFTSYNLNRAGSLLSDDLNYAHQTSLTRNSEVEVRIYKVGSKADTTDLQYRAFRCILSSSGQPLELVRRLPEQFIISADPNFSTILDYTNVARSGINTGSETLPGMSTASTYVSFAFRATGGTGLSPVTPPVGIWDLTVLSQQAPKDATTGLPKNYVTVQIDPVNGHVRTYRP